MASLPLLAYLALVTWAVIESNRRWMTLLWVVIGLAATIGAFMLAGAVWPDLAEVLGHTALIPSFLVSALIGVSYMRSHRRPSAPKAPSP